MHTPHYPLKRQRGVAAIWVVIFIIIGVMLTLTQVYDIAGTRGVATMQQSDSTTALFVAESGLQRASGLLNQAVANGSYNGGVCTSITGGPYSVGGGGSFSYVGTPVSTPTANCSGAECTGCSLSVTGTAGDASRTLTLTYRVESQLLGVNNCGTTPTLRLVNNDAAFAGTALFNLAWRRQMASNEYASYCTRGDGGNASVSICTNCNLRWNVESSSGNPSAGAMGVAAEVGPGGSYIVTQTIDTNRHYTMVGALLVGKSTIPPAIVGSYWDDIRSNGTGTVNNTSGGSANNGETNSGVATTTGACDAAPLTYNASRQNCTRWCFGGDTLVLGIAGRSDSYADGIPDSPGVRFNTGGAAGKQVAMTRLARFPETDGSPASTGDTFSEFWYAYNPPLADVVAGNFVVGRAYLIKETGSTSFTAIGASSNAVGTIFTATGAGTGTGKATPQLALASSYKGHGTGAIGAAWTGTGNTAADIAGVPTLTVTTFSGYPARIISVGDSVSSSGGVGNNINCTPSCPTIVSQITSTEPGGALGGRGTYRLSTTQTVTDSTSRNWTASSSVLNVSSCTICYFAPGDNVSGLTTNKSINSQLTPLWAGESQGGVGRYLLTSSGNPSLPTLISSANTLRAGTPDATLYQPATESVPLVVPNHANKIALFSNITGAGAFDATTHTVVTGGIQTSANNETKYYAVSPPPTTPLDTAYICAGTCPLFNNPSSTSAITQYQISRTAGVTQWASGFACVSGVDGNKIFPIYDVSRVKAGRWSEQGTP